MRSRYHLNFLAAAGLALALALVACNPFAGLRRTINQASTAAAVVSTQAVVIQTAVGASGLQTAVAGGEFQTAVVPLSTAVANPTNLAGLTGLTGGVVAIIEQGGKTSFLPDSVTIRAGDSVRWTNTTPRVQAVEADDNSWTTGDIPTFATGQFRFDRTGTYGYHAKGQADSKGKVIVQ